MSAPYFNSPEDPNFPLYFIKLHNLCRDLQIWYSLHYNEAPNTWYIVINSSIRGQEYVSKDCQLSTAFDYVFEWLEKIKANQ